MKKLITLFVALVLALSCAAFAETENKTIVIGATPSPHVEILEQIVDDMAALGYTLEIKTFTDYNLPCAAVASGDIDANYFAHIPFINSYNESVSEDEQVTPVIGVHYEPFGIYSNKYSSIEELPENATVCIPNDASNQSRALFLLQEAGLCKLPDGAVPTDTYSINDVVEWTNGLTCSDIDASQTPAVRDDYDIVVINGNYALDAGLSPLQDAIFYESNEGQSAEIYANYVVVRPADVDADWVEALRTCLCSEKIYNYMIDTYAGAVVPYFTIDTEEEE